MCVDMKLIYRYDHHFEFNKQKSGVQEYYEKWLE